VQFQIADGYHLYTQLFGRWIRWHHGDSIRYQGGIGGLTIPVRKAISEWNKGRRADLDVFGHWHTSHMDRDFISNGSAVGYSPYAVRIKAPFESPAQTLAVFESKRWLTSYRPVYVR
jgi:hypothetical protein